MNTREVAQLLTMASLIDGRDVTDEQVLMWHRIVGDLDYDDAQHAVEDHFRASRDWLMPRHVVERVKLAPRTSNPQLEDCYDVGQEHRWLGDGTCMRCTARKGQLPGPRTSKPAWYAEAVARATKAYHDGEDTLAAAQSAREDAEP